MFRLDVFTVPFTTVSLSLDHSLNQIFEPILKPSQETTIGNIFISESIFYLEITYLTKLLPKSKIFQLISSSVCIQSILHFLSRPFQFQ